MSCTALCRRHCTDAAAVAHLKSAMCRDHLNVVFIGHVDAGKSTIGGQILYLTGGVDERTIQKYERCAVVPNTSEVERSSMVQHATSPRMNAPVLALCSQMQPPVAATICGLAGCTGSHYRSRQMQPCTGAVDFALRWHD